MEIFKYELNGIVVFDVAERLKFCNGCFKFGYYMLKEEFVTC